MSLYDAHCHLDQISNPEHAIDRARARGVDRIVAVTEGIESGKIALALSKQHPDCVFAGIGIHPMFSVSLSKEEISDGLSFIEDNINAADLLGEVGLDYRYAVTDDEKSFQGELLTKMLDIAAAAKKPVNLHSRRSQRQTMEAAIKYKKKTGLPVALHWFTQSKKLIRICAEEGIFVSAGPSVLFDEHSAQVSLHIPDSLLLVETDSPVPFNSEPAEPAWAARVAERIAEVRGRKVADLEPALNDNLERYLMLD